MTVAVITATIVLVCLAVLGFATLAWDARRSRTADRRDLVVNRFQDLRITPVQLLIGPPHGAHSADLPGLRASVLTGDQIAARAAQGQHTPKLDKPADPRFVYLVVEGPEITVVREIPPHSRLNEIAQAHRFSGALNTRATELEDQERAAGHSAAAQ